MPPGSTGGGLEKAYIVLVEPPNPASAAPSLSSITSQARGGGEGRIDFMFNPSTYTVTKGATWGRVPSRSASSSTMPEFVGSTPAKMDLDILIDHTDRQTATVAAQVDLLLSSVVPIPRTIDQNRPTPPWAVFGWGTRIPMVAFISSVSATYQLFKPDGTPLRAMCKVSLEEIPTSPAPRQNPTSGGLRVQRQHTVIAGDSLPSIAADAYGKASHWRALALANNIDDPMRLREGDTLLLPHHADLIDSEEG